MCSFIFITFCKGVVFIKVSVRTVLILALKAFFLCFFSALIPELVVVLSASVPDATFWSVTLPPLLCAALAAGVSSAWSVVEQHLRKDVEITPEDVQVIDGEPFEL